MDREQEGRTVLPGKDIEATRRKDSVTAKRWKGNRKEVQCYWEKMDRQQKRKHSVSDEHATGRKDSVTKQRYKGNMK